MELWVVGAKRHQEWHSLGAVPHPVNLKLQYLPDTVFVQVALQLPR